MKSKKTIFDLFTMTSICNNITQIKQEIGKVQLCVVSKYRTLDELNDAYTCGHRVFGENRVQELLVKYESMPKDIEWHAIGHLQRNKVKYIAPFISLIHSIDSLKLLQEVDKEARKNGRIIDVLLQVHIAKESSKFGLQIDEVAKLIRSDTYQSLANIRCVGLMGMATFTDDTHQVKEEFSGLSRLYNALKDSQEWTTLSMGMSGDYMTAIESGSTLIRVGSKIFT